MHEFLLRSVGVGLALGFIAAAASAQTGRFPAAAEIGSVDDPQLKELVGETLSTHPQVLAAEAAVESGRASVLAAERPLFNPELGLGVDRSDTTDRTLRLTQTFDRANQRGARTRVASSELDVGLERLAIARRNLSLELLSTLGSYWAAHEIAALAARRDKLMQRLTEVVAERGKVGDTTQADQNLARLASAQARIKHASAAAEAAAAEQRLRALTRHQGNTFWPRLPTDLPSVDLTASRRDQLVARLPEVVLKRRQMSVAAAQITLEERQRRANPTLSLSGGREDDAPSLGLSFSMPLNIRNRHVHEVAAARAEQDRAEYELDDTRLRARAALEAATARYRQVRDAWTDWIAGGAPSLTQQGDLLERLWRAGELDLTDYLVQLNQTLDTQVSALELERELWLAWLDWLGASGQLGDWLGLPMNDAESSSLSVH